MAEEKSTYLQYLPTHQQSDEVIGQFLLAMERILKGWEGSNSSQKPGLEQYIENIHTYFYPGTSPTDFLPWLAGWVAASLEEDWDEDFKRNFISNVVPLYKMRGTKQGMKELLKLYTGSDRVNIQEFDNIPNYFEVEIFVKEKEEEILNIASERAKLIIEMQKPAGAIYSLKMVVPKMEVTDECDREKRGIRVGVNTHIEGRNDNRRNRGNRGK
ncbi:MAG: phage tail protein I [Oscillatoria sp. SIO1A7]|nr:phage tail protein I [Oscillatoria sp. SIO1A7]